MKFLLYSKEFMIKRGGGPKEVLLQAIIHKNIGCSYFLIEENQSSGSFTHWNAKEAFQLVDKYKDEIGIIPILLPNFFYLKSSKQYLPESQVSTEIEEDIEHISEKDIMHILDKGLELPEWLLMPQGIFHMCVCVCCDLLQQLKY